MNISNEHIQRNIFNECSLATLNVQVHKSSFKWSTHVFKQSTVVVITSMSSTNRPTAMLILMVFELPSICRFDFSVSFESRLLPSISLMKLSSRHFGSCPLQTPLAKQRRYGSPIILYSGRHEYRPMLSKVVVLLSRMTLPNANTGGRPQSTILQNGAGALHCPLGRQMLWYSPTSW